MIPVALDPTRLAMAVAGRGPKALQRFRALRAGGAGSALLFCDAAAPDFAAEAGQNLRARLPDAADLAGLAVLWVVELPEDEAAALAEAARARRVLVNVEDVTPLCDFHSVAEIRRGDLLLTVSTGGRSPGLAARIRGRLADEFGAEWADRLAEIGALRDRWRQEGRSLAELGERTNAAIDAAGWLS